MKVSEHAVNRYIERLLGLEVRQVGDSVRVWIKGRIIKLMAEPHIIYNMDEDRPPIHIRNEMAAPVKDDGGVQVATSIYKSETFKDKIN